MNTVMALGDRYEKNIPTVRNRPQTPPRLSLTYGDCKWPQNPRASPRQRPQAPVCIGMRSAPLGNLMTDTDLKLGSLTKRSEFLHVRDGRYAARKTVVVQMRKCNAAKDGVRAGFTATKKIGGAVVRNRCKRRLRALARAHLPALGKPGHDYVFIARHNTATAPHDMLAGDIQKALEKLRAGGHNARNS